MRWASPTPASSDSESDRMNDPITGSRYVTFVLAAVVTFVLFILIDRMSPPQQ